MTIDPELLSVLGVPDPGYLHMVNTLHPSPGRAARAAGPRELASLLTLLTAWQDLTPARIPIYRVEEFIAFAADAPVEVLAGTPVNSADLTGFDSGSERVILRFASEEGPVYVVDAHQGVVSTYHLDPLHELAPLALPAEAPPPPDVAGWFSNASEEAWLVDAAGAYAAGASAPSRVAAAGIVCRLAGGAGGGDSEASPRSSARAWLRALPPETVVSVESQAVRSAAYLAERLDEFDPVSEPDAERAVAELVEERDQLASVQRSLRVAGAGAELATALEATDRVASSKLSALAGLLPILTEDAAADRWHAVAWREPEAWWVGE